jgi:transcriptional regulator with GAF, ATPase, and Fis domain
VLGGARSRTTSPPRTVRCPRPCTRSRVGASEVALDVFQREYLGRLLARTNGNVSLAAREADMSRRYLQTLIQRLGLGDSD